MSTTLGRKVYKKVAARASGATTITYEDGTNEYFGPFCGYVPEVGDREIIDDTTGTRTHWHSDVTGINPINYYTSGTAVINTVWGTSTGSNFSYGTCTKCKETTNLTDAITYNWSTKWEHSHLKRYICNKCHTKAMDKFYELDRSVETEEILYGKPQEKGSETK